jgi:hypothetical protein
MAVVFFGIAFLWRTPPHPTEPPADVDLTAQFLPIQEVAPQPANNDAVGASSSAPTVDKAAASLTSAAASEHELPALKATALETAFVPPARSARGERVRIALYHRQVARERHRVAPWRPDARAGPNSGGGFYGPPNVNVGYINPR